MRPPSIAIFTVVAALAGPAEALAAVNLKQVQVSGGARVDLLFDGKISRTQIKTEFFNDIIQLSLTDTAVYPAKISSISGGDLTKVFAYQYAPKLVRCRLSVKGKAEDFKSRLVLDQKGNMLTIRFDETTDSIASNAAQAVRAQVAAKVKAKTSEKAAEKAAERPSPPETDDADPGERALLERILNNVKPADAQKAAEQKADAQADAKRESATAAVGPQPLANGKPLLSPATMLLKMLGVIALFGLCAFGVRKLLMAGGNAQRSGTLSRLLQRSMSKYGKAGKMIEVVSTHHLGPKKSIAVVKVAGRNLVLGISQDSINLITQLDGSEGTSANEAEMDEIDLAALGVNAGPAIMAPRASSDAAPRAMAGSVASNAFDSVLDEEATRPQLEPNGARARIRSRLEGMKPL